MAASADIVPLLETLRIAGLSFLETNAGQSSEARLQGMLANQAGTALTKKGDLTALIKDDGHFSTAELRRYIRLADTNDGNRAISPIIYVDGDFSRKYPLFRVQLIVVTGTNIPEDTAQCLLLRFETPEGDDPSGSGKHDYYHSQLCTSFRITGPDNAIAVPDSLSWLALSCPAWPLDAKTPVHLLACVIFALYGKSDGVRLLQQAYGDKLEASMEGMHFAFGLQGPSRRRAQERSQKRRRK
jgi:hypothetical protein